MPTVLLTGANRGIGLALARGFLARGHTVIAVCRRSSPEFDALGVRVLDGVDVTDDASIATLPGRLSGTRIDVLVNNAGILERETLDRLDPAGWRRQMEVNAFGPLALTAALLPLLALPAKVVVITSRMGSIGDNGSGGYHGYRMSKAAVNAAFVSLARDLAPRGVAVGIYHPGMVATEMTGRHGIPPEQAADGLLARIEALDAATSGRFFHQDGTELPW
jgi:NAD(P)-dependent dehydrogenase (short-subunit alcohol dehydrogenase family)